MKKKSNFIYLIKYLFIVILLILYNINIPKEKNLIDKTHKNNNNNCFLSSEILNKKIVHIIITRFMLEFCKGFRKKIYKKKYITNGIRVMKKYLFPSLYYQSCKDFIWMLNLGDKANITYIKSLLNFYRPFKSVIIYNKNYKNYIRNITKGADVLITTRIDYDDRIYWDAVNDVRKIINISKPVFLHGYNRGFIYYEDLNIYAKFFNKYNNSGPHSVFASLIINKKKVNDSYTIYDLGAHTKIKKNLIKGFKKYGLEKLDYEPAIFEIDVPKFVWVRQHWSGMFVKTNKSKIKSIYFDFNKFYGIKKK